MQKYKTGQKLRNVMQFNAEFSVDVNLKSVITKCMDRPFLHFNFREVLGAKVI
jgi:hypothetical protein